MNGFESSMLFHPPPRPSGRLLAGVKWNPVRQRVDTLHARGDQLILGTLIFSTLLFLFPTTLVYYFVFSLVSLGLCLKFKNLFVRNDIGRLDCSLLQLVQLHLCKSAESEYSWG